MRWRSPAATSDGPPQTRGAAGALVRRAAPADVDALHGLVQELAAYERAADEVAAVVADLDRALFGAAPALFAHVAELDGTVVGCAIWYLTYSTWTGRHGIWLEDLYVQPAARGTGLGRRLLAALATECAERGLRRLEWAVLDWNEPALRFYHALGAAPVAGWTRHRLDGEALRRLGAEV